MTMDLAEALPSPEDHPVAPDPIISVPEKGGFFRRTGAAMIDFFVIELIFIIFLVITEAALDLSSAGGTVMGSDPLDLQGMGPFLSLWMGLFILYFTFFTYWGGQTPGKMVMRVRVVMQDLDELSLTRSLARTLCYFLSSFFFGVGFIMAAVNREKRALHDFITGTIVIRV